MLIAFINWLLTPLPFYIAENADFAFVYDDDGNQRDATPDEFPGYHLCWTDPDRASQIMRWLRLPMWVGEMEKTGYQPFDHPYIIKYHQTWHQLHFGDRHANLDPRFTGPISSKPFPYFLKALWQR